MKGRFKPLSEKEEIIAREIVDAAYTVHKNLGPRDQAEKSLVPRASLRDKGAKGESELGIL